MRVTLWRVTPTGREGPIDGEATAAHRSLRVDVAGKIVMVSATTGWAVGTLRERYGHARTGLLMDAESLKACEALMWCDCPAPQPRVVKTRRRRWICVRCLRGRKGAEK